MISFIQAERVHALLVAEFGGATGLRDPGGLEACLARPYQPFAGDDLYPTPAGKAAAMLESIIIRVAEGKSSVEEIQAWIEARIRQA
jgi:prophage maintenance system killer protein